MQADQTRRFRGKNKAPKWAKPDDGTVSVMVLPLAVTDPADLDRLEKLFGSMWSIKRAVHATPAPRSMPTGLPNTNETMTAPRP